MLGINGTKFIIQPHCKVCPPDAYNGVDYSKKESEEVRKLRRKNKQLEEELAFLKKAAAYFANDQK